MSNILCMTWIWLDTLRRQVTSNERYSTPTATCILRRFSEYSLRYLFCILRMNVCKIVVRLLSFKLLNKRILKDFFHVFFFLYILFFIYLFFIPSNFLLFFNLCSSFSTSITFFPFSLRPQSYFLNVHFRNRPYPTSNTYSSIYSFLY